jgi:hypothetical protein
VGLRIRVLPHRGQGTTLAVGHAAEDIAALSEGDSGSESGFMVLLLRSHLWLVYLKVLRQDIILATIGQGRRLG